MSKTNDAPNERWERIKRHLFRNMLVNPGFPLSPIPEEERSSPDSDGSLPDLIVEPEPDRHDDPPAFYEGLERRMKRYYRQLFLGQNGSEDDISDFEVNRSMASTFKLDISTGKDKAINIQSNENEDSDLNVSITNEKRLTKSRDNDKDTRVREEFGDKLIDSFGTYNETSHESTDDSNKSSRRRRSIIVISDEVDDELQSLETRSKSDENQSNLNEDIEAIDNNHNGQDNRLSLANKDAFDSNEFKKDIQESEMLENKSISEDSVQNCHRISTTVAQIHQTPVRGVVQFDNGSPVLIPRLLQFGRSLFGSGQSGGITRFSRQTIKVLETYEEKKQDDPTEGTENDAQRLLSASELTRIRLTYTDDESTADKSNKTNIEDINQVRKLQTDEEGSDVKSDLNDKTVDITDMQTTSIDWNKYGINDDEDCFDTAISKIILLTSDDSLENVEPMAHSTERSNNEDVEVLRQARESGGKVSWHGEFEEASPVLAFETKTSADKLENLTSSSNEINASLEKNNEKSVKDHTTPEALNDATIMDDFWAIWDEEDLNSPTETTSEPNDSTGSSRRSKDSSSSSNRIRSHSKDSSCSNKRRSSLKKDNEKSIEVYKTPRILDDFWSVSSIEIDFDDLPTDKDLDSSNNTTSDSKGNHLGDSSCSNKRSESQGSSCSNQRSDSKYSSGPKKRGSDSREKYSSNSNKRTPDLKDSSSPNNLRSDSKELSGPNQRSDLKDSYSPKRRSDASDAAPLRKKKKNNVSQTNSDGNRWENMKQEFFVGTPLVLKLCGCKDHVCK